MDQTGFFGNRDKVHRHNQAIERMLPTHQRFITHNLGTQAIGDRLVIKAQLAFGNGIAQIHFDDPSLTGGIVHFQAEVLKTVATIALGFVQRHIGAAQQMLRCTVLVIRHSNTNA